MLSWVRSRRTLPALLLGALGAAFFAGERDARATNVTEFPDNGSEQMQRGGAWIARASTPLAVFYNPAGLAGQDTRLSLDMNIAMQHTCYTRIKAAGDTTQEPLADPTTGVFPQACGKVTPFPNPQLSFAYRATDRIGLGIALLGPSGVGQSSWPTFQDNAAGPQASSNRYLIAGEGNFFVLNPSIGVGAEVIDNLRVGASLEWGMMAAKFATSSSALNGNNQSARGNDVQATLIVADYFIPGFTLGALYSPVEFLDIAGWYKWSDSVKARGDVYTQAGFYTPAVAKGDSSGIIDGDTSVQDCYSHTSTKVCGGGNNATLKLAVPMEAKLGFRFHKPRHHWVDQDKKARHTRDPMAQDVFDTEVDLTWTNNSAMDGLIIRFPGDQNNDGVIPVNGTPGTLPPNADIPGHFKDVFGVRVGGDFNVLPDQLALRAGAFWESQGQDPTYQTLDFTPAARLGVAGGGTYRFRLDREKTRAIEVSLGFMHVFYANTVNDNPNNDGLHGLAGSACNPAGNSRPGDTCSDGKQKYRTNWPVNLGTITNALNVINVGAAYRF